MVRQWLSRGAWALLILLLIAFVALASWEPFWADREGVAPPPEALEQYQTWKRGMEASSACGDGSGAGSPSWIASSVVASSPA